ncbi:MAG: hypothetical protein KR126chlam1_01472 [Chlamydiae bacterium]|nr:hypothetical protein [Chlamydiota bacterium]
MKLGHFFILLSLTIGLGRSTEVQGQNSQESCEIQVAGMILSNFSARCTNCSEVYVNYVPSECDRCNNSDFDIEYTDYWDRKNF